MVEPIGAQRRPKVAGKLTGVSRNSGWGFGAVELYCWWYTEGSWTWTHTYTNTLARTQTHTPTPEWEVGEREFKRKKAKRKENKEGGGAGRKTTR